MRLPIHHPTVNHSLGAFHVITLGAYATRSPVTLCLHANKSMNRASFGSTNCT